MGYRTVRNTVETGLQIHVFAVSRWNQKNLGLQISPYKNRLQEELIPAIIVKRSQLKDRNKNTVTEALIWLHRGPQHIYYMSKLWSAFFLVTFTVAFYSLTRVNFRSSTNLWLFCYSCIILIYLCNDGQAKFFFVYDQLYFINEKQLWIYMVLLEDAGIDKTLPYCKRLRKHKKIIWIL